jgi:hypothetical protein
MKVYLGVVFIGALLISNNFVFYLLYYKKLIKYFLILDTLIQSIEAASTCYAGAGSFTIVSCGSGDTYCTVMQPFLN